MRAHLVDNLVWPYPDSKLPRRATRRARVARHEFARELAGAGGRL